MSAERKAFVIKCFISGSAVATVGALFVVAHLVQDINRFYYESMDELVEFKEIANDAWESMLDFQRHETFNSIFNHRQKRQNNVAVLREGPHGYVRRPARLDGYRSVPVARPPPSYVRNSNGQCGNCAQRSNKCPRGPPGPPGNKGDDGLPGDPGQDGSQGVTPPTEDANNSYATGKSCIKCPAGPPGPPGQIGETGPVGPPGDNGTPGQPGKSFPGPMGEPGDIGISGQPGIQGNPGENINRLIPIPGPKGTLGPIGSPGSKGEDGTPAPPSSPGPVGPMDNASGSIGNPGINGEVGEPGIQGKPGQDRLYCGCPKRTTALYSESPSKKSY